MKIAVYLLVAGIPLLACSAGQGAQCRVGADCASGACDATGKCVVAPAVDGGSDAAATDGSTPTDAAPSDASQRDVRTDSPSASCTADNDGIITRAEVPIGPGLHAKYKIAENVTVSTAGVAQPDGTRVWDLTAALSGDHDVVVDTLPLAATWYAPKFAGATYATKLSDTQDLIGVFETTDPALLLRGVVSPSDGNTRTELTYSPSVPTLSFPLQKGAAWNTNTTVSGLAQGVTVTYFESYQSKVDAAGTLKAPFGTFPVLRVHVVLTRTVGALVTITRTFVFVAECFGPVAAVVSQTNESADEFTSAAEVRRLAP